MPPGYRSGKQRREAIAMLQGVYGFELAHWLRGPSPKVEEIALAVVSVLEEARFRVVLTEA